MQVSKSELIHHRLQAMLREHSFSDLKYIGVKPDSVGIDQHWYMIVNMKSLSMQLQN